MRGAFDKLIGDLQAVLERAGGGLSALRERIRTAVGDARTHFHPPSRALTVVPEQGRALLDSSRAVFEHASRALAIIPQRSRELAGRIPTPVQVHFRRFSNRSAHFGREALAGLFVVGLVAVMIAYGRLNNGPISLPSLVPMIEESINRELTGLRVEIDDAIIQRVPGGAGVNFRLTDIKLMESDGTIVAQSPLAAIGLSGYALLSGRIAPGSVDFIGPRLLLFYNGETGLSLTFSRPAGDEALAGPAAQDREPAPASPETIVSKRSERPPQPPRRSATVNVTRAVTNVFERARAGSHTSSYLTRFGVKDAVVKFDRDGTQTTWRVPDFEIGLKQEARRSVLLGNAELASSEGPWKIEFRTEQAGHDGGLLVHAVVRDLVPDTLAGNFSGFGVLEALDIPVTAEASFSLTPEGELKAATATLRLARGEITVPWEAKHPMRIDSGDLHIRYVKDENRIEILPSTLEWGGSHATISGAFKAAEGPAGEPRTWDFSISALTAVLHTEEFGLPPLYLDEWRTEGSVSPEAGRLDITRYVMRAGDAWAELSGHVVDAAQSPSIRVSGRLSPMPISIAKQFWPKFIGAPAREWVGMRVPHGRVTGGWLEVDIPAGMIADVIAGGDIPPEAIQWQMGVENVAAGYIEHLPPLLMPKGTLRGAGRSFAFDAEQGRIPLGSGKEIRLTNGSFMIHDMRPDPDEGEIVFEASAPTPAVLELLDHEPFKFISKAGMNPQAFGGRAVGAYRIFLPLRKGVKFQDMRIRGDTRFTEVTAPNIMGETSIEGGVVDVTVTEHAAEAKGDIRVKGVETQLTWQRIFSLPDEKQPPLRLFAVLDKTAREQLGLSVDHLIRGALPVNLIIGKGAGGDKSMRLRANLTNVELSVAGWEKEPGVSAQAEFEVVKNSDGTTELRNFRILGDEIAIEGVVALDAENKLRAFSFPEFSFNLQTHVNVSGVKRDDGVLEVNVTGPSYDGRQFFDSLISASEHSQAEAPPQDEPPLELNAEIDNVIGHHNTTLRNAKLTVRKEAGGQLVGLTASGQINGGAALGVALDTSNGGRILQAEAADAGAAFRLVGFYPKVEGGEASLEVDLDGGDEPGEKSGTLWARNFTVLGDKVVGEVLSNQARVPGQTPQRTRQQRSRINFDQLRAPFSVGDGQFRLRDAYINGPLLGATLRGTVDFNTQQIDLGGTYVPLYGLNAAFSEIPLLGPLLSGRQGEGVFGITFAVQGSMDNPNVLVNPLSMVAPGFLRQIFEIGGNMPSPQQQRRAPTASTRAPWQ